MVERITSITVQAFRGVRDSFSLTLENRLSCIILGDNATGKSTIADAVEWYLTGQISLLTKEGRSDAIRHSGAAAGIETKVTVSTDGSLTGEITTSASSPQAVKEVGRSEIFLLRGGTLADFVNKTRGEKWQALAKILGLEAIDRLRLDLQRVKNELEDAARRAREDLKQKRAVLAQKMIKASEAGIVEAFQEQCRAAQVDPPDSLDQALDPEWLRSMVPEGSLHPRTAALQATVADLRSISEQPISLDPIDEWNRFLAGEAANRLNIGLFQAADSLIQAGQAEQDRCPLCGQSVDLDALARHVSAELASMESAARALEDAQQAARRFVSQLHDAYTRQSGVRQRGLAQSVQLDELPVSPADELNPQIDQKMAIDRQTIWDRQEDLASWDKNAIRALESAIPAPPTERDQALIEIGVLHSEASNWRNAELRRTEADGAFDLSNRIFARYQSLQHDHFSNVVQQMSSRVAEIYQLLHPEGGIGTVAVETVGDKGAELSVEFHGRKELPPHRVLSESHLNSLGVALFLAMAETFNKKIGFLVLDDIVNSFDREHRGRLAEVLVDKFEDKQLIILTHDEQFFTQLSGRAPSWVKEHFISWSYRGGPRTKQYQSDRLLEDAAKDLSEADRIGAAQKGRRAFEEFMQEACERLETPLPFRRGQRNDQRMADELIRGLRRTLKDRAPALNQDLQGLLNLLGTDLQAVLNVESHASELSSSIQEVTDALGRVTRLRDRFTCQDCGTRIWYSGAPKAPRCRCGRIRFPSS